jgi:hypothetical protein
MPRIANISFSIQTGIVMVEFWGECEVRHYSWEVLKIDFEDIRSVSALKKWGCPPFVRPHLFLLKEFVRFQKAGGEPNLFFFSLRHQAVGAGPFAVFKGSAYEDGCGTSIMLAHASGSAQTGSPSLWTRRSAFHYHELLSS